MASVRQLTKPNRHGKRPWVVEFTDAEGKRRRETPRSGLFKDADALRKRIERDETDGNLLAVSQTVTVAKLCDLYAEHIEDKLRDGRIQLARSKRLAYDLRAIRDGLGPIRLTDLTSNDVDRLYADFLRRGKPSAPPTTIAGMARSTCSRPWM